MQLQELLAKQKHKHTERIRYTNKNTQKHAAAGGTNKTQNTQIQIKAAKSEAEMGPVVVVQSDS